MREFIGETTYASSVVGEELNIKGTITLDRSLLVNINDIKIDIYHESIIEETKLFEKKLNNVLYPRWLDIEEEFKEYLRYILSSVK